MSESALTFSELQIYVALKLGVAYYGAAGDEVAQAPTDTETLQRVKDFVNGGIRMFLMDAPAEGWRFQQPIASVVLWATSSSTASGTPSYVSPSSTVTVNASVFYDSMVGHDLKFTVTSTADGTPTYTTAKATSVIDVDDAIFSGVFAVGQTITFSETSNSYTVTSITDTTTVIVDGDASSEADGDTVTITRDYPITSITSTVVAVVTGDASGESDGATVTVTADGNYTLPSTFGGESSGRITYTAATNAGTSIGWSDEGTIRRWRENTETQTGYPTLAAIRKMDATNVARRWELIVYPTSGGDYTIQFPYELYFTELTADADLPPAGAHYDEAIKSACLAYAEMHGEDNAAGFFQYYSERALPAAHRINRRSAPRRLGNLLKRRDLHIEDYRSWVERPDVTVS